MSGDILNQGWLELGKVRLRSNLSWDILDQGLSWLGKVEAQCNMSGDILDKGSLGVYQVGI